MFGLSRCLLVTIPPPQGETLTTLFRVVCSGAADLDGDTPLRYSLLVREKPQALSSSSEARSWAPAIPGDAWSAQLRTTAGRAHQLLVKSIRNPGARPSGIHPTDGSSVAVNHGDGDESSNTDNRSDFDNNSNNLSSNVHNNLNTFNTGRNNLNNNLNSGLGSTPDHSSPGVAAAGDSVLQPLVVDSLSPSLQALLPASRAGHQEFVVQITDARGSWQTLVAGWAEVTQGGLGGGGRLPETGGWLGAGEGELGGVCYMCVWLRFWERIKKMQPA